MPYWTSCCVTLHFFIELKTVNCSTSNDVSDKKRVSTHPELNIPWRCLALPVSAICNVLEFHRGCWKQCEEVYLSTRGLTHSRNLIDSKRIVLTNNGQIEFRYWFKISNLNICKNDDKQSQDGKNSSTLLLFAVQSRPIDGTSFASSQSRRIMFGFAAGDVDSRLVAGRDPTTRIVRFRCAR